MARVLFSGFGIVDMRGKVNGTVASKNRSGAYLRTKVTGSNPRTPAQLTARGRLTFNSQAWRSLGLLVIAAWNSAVDGYAKSNVFGNKVNPTGKNLYTALNNNLASVGVAPIATVPLPEGAEQPVLTDLSMADDGVGSITVTGTTAASKVQIWATAPQSPGVRFFKGKYRLIGFLPGNAVTAAAIGPLYVTRFGAPAAGQLVAVQVVAINATTGESSLPSDQFVEVEAA